jgi:hypothetical protein
MKKQTIITSNEEIYKKLNQLHFSSEVTINKASNKQMNKILESLNKYNNTVSMEKIKDKFKLKKNGKLNFNFYLSRPK